MNQLAFAKTDLPIHLKEGKFSAEALFQIYVVQTKSHFFQVRPHGVSEEMQFRSAIARSTQLTLNEVFIVGSAQVGFSIKPTAQLREFDSLFKTTSRQRDKSDVDVAIVSAKYFDRVHEDLYKLTKGFSTEWKYNAYYPDEGRMAHFGVKRADAQLYQYLAKGWLRPDFAPNDFKFDFREEADMWARRLDRKVSVGIYREWRYLKEYQLIAFDQLRQAAIRGAI